MSVRVDLLRSIDGVPWERLYHAYGPASDVPGQLRGLGSEVASVRAEALRQLSGNVYHQGSRWPASAYVVPILVDLVDDPDTPDRAMVLDLLTAVAIGGRRDDELPFDPVRAFAAGAAITEEQITLVASYLFHGDDEMPADVVELADAVASRWAADAYLAAARHVGRYSHWLRDGDTEIAARAAAFLAWFAPTDQAVTALLAVPEDDPASPVRASANLALAHLPTTQAHVDTRLLSLLGTGHEAVRVSAAVALAYRAGDYLPDPALSVLVEATEREWLIDVPGWDRSLRGFAALALQRLGLA